MAFMAEDWAALTRGFGENQKTKGSGMKEYLKEHKDLIYTIAILAVLDHIFLGGALKDKIRQIIENLLSGKENPKVLSQ